MFLRFCVWNEKMGAYDNNVEELISYLTLAEFVG